MLTHSNSTHTFLTLHSTPQQPNSILSCVMCARRVRSVLARSQCGTVGCSKTRTSCLAACGTESQLPRYIHVYKGCVRDSVDALFFICVLPCDVEAPYQVTPLVNLSSLGTCVFTYSCRAPLCCNHAFGAREPVICEVCFSVALENNTCNRFMNLYLCNVFWVHIR